MTTLVTNGTGHLGANLVRALLDEGTRVRVLVRPASGAATLDGLGVEITRGDVTDAASLRTALWGVSHVYHVAALVSLRRCDRARLYETNVLGTRAVLEACLDAGVKRVVHTSSFGAVGHVPGEPSTEDTPFDPFAPESDYDLSKHFAEHEVLWAVARGLDVVMVNPSGIVGPHDSKPSHLGRVIRDFGRGKLPAYVPGSFDFVPVRDVVQGHLLAMERGRCGQRYLLTGELVTVDTMMDWLEAMTGRRKPRLRIPSGALLPAAEVQDWLLPRVRPTHHPTFTAHSLRLLRSGKHGTNARARRELGLEPTSVRDAFAEAAAWFSKPRTEGHRAAHDPPHSKRAVTVPRVDI